MTKGRKKVDTLHEEQVKAQRSDGFITVEEASKETKFSKPVLYSWAREGRIRSRKFGFRWRYVNLEDIQKLMRDQGHSPKAA